MFLSPTNMVRKKKINHNFMAKNALEPTVFDDSILDLIFTLFAVPALI